MASHRTRSWLTQVALLAFTLRALIPVGFMPSGEGFLRLQICPEGLSAQALAILDPHAAHHHHHAGHDHQSWASGHCAFAAVASAPPCVHAIAPAQAAVTASLTAVPAFAPLAASHRYRIAQPRGPPALS